MQPGSYKINLKLKSPFVPKFSQIVNKALLLLTLQLDFKVLLRKNGFCVVKIWTKQTRIK